MDFSDIEKKGLYKAIFSRRDIRSQYNSKKIEGAVLKKILMAGHHAPSVGYMQPWNFLVVEDLSIRQKIKQVFLTSKKDEEECIEKDKIEKYQSLKLEGILESSLNLCVTCDSRRFGSTGLGRSQMKNMDLYSTVCAVHNIWLAARAEGIGVGWVSILNEQKVKTILQIPSAIEIVAYLCMGYVDAFPEIPELETKGWRSRLDVRDLTFYNSWKNN